MERDLIKKGKARMARGWKTRRVIRWVRRRIDRLQDGQKEKWISGKYR